MLAPIFGRIPRGISQSDVSHAADSLLRTGNRPTVEKIRTKLGRGSPNTINPMLDAWWKTLAARLDSGPAALHRLPESIAHIAEALWMQALEEGKRRAALEQRDSTRLADLDQQRLELRSHVLTLREGELDSRLRDRDCTIEELNSQLRELTGLLRKEQATRESQLQRITTLEAVLARSKPRTCAANTSAPPALKSKPNARRAGPLRNATKRKKKPKRSAPRQRK